MIAFFNRLSELVNSMRFARERATGERLLTRKINFLVKVRVIELDSRLALF